MYDKSFVVRFIFKQWLSTVEAATEPRLFFKDLLYKSHVACVAVTCSHVTVSDC